MVSISKLLALILLAAGSESKKASWHKWHSRRLQDVQTIASNKNLLRSLGLHLDGRALLDRLSLSQEFRRKGLNAIEEHREVIDKLFDVQKSGVDVSSLTDALYKVESQAADQYEKLVEAGIISSPRPLRDDELASALRDATGIDPSEENDADAELFRIMAKHWDHKPPASALGVSAKFHADGRVERARYHVALHLPCSDSWDAHRLARSAEAAATTLGAPALVQSWVSMIEKLPMGSIDSMGFGVALVSDGSRAGKIYVTNPGGSPMPHLPVGGDKVLGDVLPTVGESLDANMVSLEWIAGDERVALRHYAIQRGVSHEQRILDFAGPGPLSTSILDLMQLASSATETVSYTPHFTQEEVSKTGQAPKASKTKLGLQLSDEHMGDERFLLLTAPVLKILGIDGKGVESWVSSSSQLGHTISNIQAGSSYITLYRHPLHLCSLEHRMEKGRRLGSHKTACELAQEEFTKHMWGGDCSEAMKWSSDCESCKNANEGDYNGACYTRCLTDWTKPCHSNCTDAISALIDACKGCANTKTWCGKLGEDGLPASFPLAACQSCNADETSCTDNDKVCVDWMNTNHPSAVFTKPFNDGDMLLTVQQPLSGVPMTCKYPINPYLDGNFPMCDTCESANNALHQMFMWGGPCQYQKTCANDRPDGMSVGVAACAASKGFDCGCGCGEILQKAEMKCSTGDDTCPANIPSKCKTSDDDFHNKCDSGPWAGLSGGGMMLWGEQMSASKCYVNNRFPSQCVKDAAYNSAQILTWLNKGEDMKNREALPAGCCDTSLQTGQMNLSTSWTSKGVGTANIASIPRVAYFPTVVMFVVLLGYIQM